WLQPQIEERGVTEEEFGELLYSCFDEAFEAVLAELPNFSPPHRRKLAEKIIAGFLEAEKQGVDRAEKVLEGEEMRQAIGLALDKAEKEAIQYAHAKIGGNKSTESQER
ncbi:MAG: hypothetical protein AAGJ83_01900, partial [Planctomycetota bacterium]